jgi:hypothetical protein
MLVVAFVGWISQYPEEKEFIYSPLCCIEMVQDGVERDGLLLFAMAFTQNSTTCEPERLTELERRSMAAAPSLPPQPSAVPQQMAVTIPMGVQAGATLLVDINGQQMQVVVPPGAYGGQLLSVIVPPSWAR